MKKNKIGFTLIELLVAIAIVAIMAAAILVSMKGYGARARSSKALAQLSSAVPSMVSCWGNGGTVSSANGNGTTNICSIATSYGNWPATSGDLSSYSYTSSVGSKSSWYFYLDSATDNVRVCCNSTMKSCKADVSGTTCTTASPIN